MILGIWDGHDAGAAIVENDQVLVCINEERLSRRKLDVGFPWLSIQACLDYLNLSPDNIEHVAFCTSDFAKTMTRLFPGIKENYYLARRRKIRPKLSKSFKYKFTEYGGNLVTKKLSKWKISKNLKKIGFSCDVFLVEHHAAHAAGAFMSGMKNAAVVTLDGVGDGLSGSVNVMENGQIKRVASLPAKHSLGIFFEHVTNLLNMRELEDEGKVMALADYAYPVKNEMKDFFSVDGLEVKAKYSSMGMYKKLKDILWHTPNEEFAWMAQNALEHWVVKFFSNVISETGLNNIYWSGGVASNIKINRKIRALPELKKWFIFPHMGDGGLALGAAMALNNQLTGTSNYNVENIYFGPSHSQQKIESSLSQSSLKYENIADPSQYAADLLEKGKPVYWYQGRMEYGPRALGNRSILAPAHDNHAKDKLNIGIKKRVWYQPFCPSVLLDDASVFSAYDAKGSGMAEGLMVMGYAVDNDFLDKMKAVVNIDGSARPQFVNKENEKFEKLLRDVKKKTGIGAVLNTSLNVHGCPIVNTPQEIIEMLKKTNNSHLIMGNYVVYGGE